MELNLAQKKYSIHNVMSWGGGKMRKTSSKVTENLCDCLENCDLLLSNSIDSKQIHRHLSSLRLFVYTIFIDRFAKNYMRVEFETI